MTRYEYYYHGNGTEEWHRYEGMCGNDKLVSVTRNYNGEFYDVPIRCGRPDYFSADWLCVNPVLPPRGEAKPCVTVPCPSFPAPPEGGGWVAPSEVWLHQYDSLPIMNTRETAVYLPDWRADNFFGKIEPDRKDEPKESTLFSKDAIAEAYEFIGDMKREEQVETILELIMAWGEDEYAPKTVFRFGKTFAPVHATGHYNIVVTPPNDYTISAIKAENGQWSTTHGAMYADWDAFVKFLVTEGEPVAKEDVEIFPPAVFPVTVVADDTDDDDNGVWDA